MIVTGKFLFTVALQGLDVLTKIPSLSPVQAFGMKRVIIPGLKWLLIKLEEVFPRDNIDGDPFEPERYDDLAAVPVSNEEENYA
jgi:hypothetical protein